MHGFSTFRLAVLVGFALVAGGATSKIQAAGSPIPVRPEKARQDIAKLLGDLDSDHFVVRREAAAHLRRMARRPEMRRMLAEEFERVLLSSETSLEVRSQLERLRVDADLPRAVPEPSAKTSAEEVQRLVGQLDDASYARRLGAARRLEWLLRDPEAVVLIVAALRERLSSAELSADARHWLEPIWGRARGLWLATDPATWRLPPVGDEQIARWIDDLARPVPQGARPEAWPVHRDAARELRDLLARDEYVSRVRKAIEARLAAGNVAPPGAARFQELIELCRPAMVAEFWQGGHHRGIQHLLIGVPSQSPGAPRPSHFDRIDDKVAHCVSGTNLSEGNYPVGVAIAHPNQKDAIFHLVNLPTPRRRMAYEYLVKRDEARRYAELSRRTFDRLLKIGQPLGGGDLLMLRQLDPRELSRFAGKFFLAVADDRLAYDGIEWTGTQGSRHNLLCVYLAANGTREAAPELLEAIKRHRILPPRAEAPYQMAWIAALSIAARDPWPEVDTWLAAQIGRSDPLVIGREGHPPELGATAAAILLARHGRTPSQFGLEPARDDVLDDLGLKAQRFTAPDWRAKVLKWWEERQVAAKAAG